MRTIAGADRPAEHGREPCSRSRPRVASSGPAGASAHAGRCPASGPRPGVPDHGRHPRVGYAAIVPDAGSDRPGWPFQSPAVARSDLMVSTPGASPVNWLLAVDSGRVRVSEPTVSCQPVAPAGHWGGSFTVRVVPFTCREGFQGVVIGTAVPVVVGLTRETLDDDEELTVAAASPTV